ncbi:MAG: sodium:solute symporter family protein, partial [Planctomycetota bacterium]
MIPLLLAQATQTAPKVYGTWLDYAVIAGYMLLILGFGSFFGTYTKTTKDFFFSGAKFSWWLIGMSMVATGVGSHSFMKYAQKGYEHGMSSGMSYMNDWFFIPFFMFGWLPIIYFSRVRSIPEYFERRFGTTARFIAVLVILEYMIGYIGFNLYTLGTAAHQVLGVEIWQAIVVISLISG